MKPRVSDALWQRLEPLPPPPPRRRFRFPGRKSLDYRKILTGILFVLRTGIAWDDLSAELGRGCGKTCRHYLRLWSQAGVWQKLHALLLAELNGADQIDWSRALIDASFAKAPERGEDTGPNPTDRSKSGSKHHVLTDAHSIPLNAKVTAVQERPPRFPSKDGEYDVANQPLRHYECSAATQRPSRPMPIVLWTDFFSVHWDGTYPEK
jgi:transposase